MLLNPACTIQLEYIRRAGAASFIIIEIRPHYCEIAADRNRPAKEVLGSAIGGEQLLLLAPACPIPPEYISRAGVGFIAITPKCPHDCVIPADRNRGAKVVVRSAVRGEKLGLLSPVITITTPEYISRAGVASIVIIVPRPHDCIIAADRDRDAKPVVGCAIRGGKLGLLAPACPIPLEYISRPIATCDGIIAADRDRVAKGLNRTRR